MLTGLPEEGSAGTASVPQCRVQAAGAEEFIAGEALYAPPKRHDVSRQLIRIWVGKFEADALDEDVQAADLIQEYDARIAALERIYRGLLAKCGNPYDSAKAECFMKALKAEAVYLAAYETFDST